MHASTQESAPSGWCSWRRLLQSSYQEFICSGIRSSFFKRRLHLNLKWAPAKLIHESMRLPTLTRTQVLTRQSRRSALLMRCFAQMRRKLFVEREQTLLRVGIVHGCGLCKCEATAMNCEKQRHLFNRAKQKHEICLIGQAHSAILALFMAVAQPSTIAKQRFACLNARVGSIWML